MKYFKEHIDEFASIIKDGEYYIILNDGKPIRENILDEDAIEVILDEKLDLDDVYSPKKNPEIEEIRNKANLNVNIRIYKDLTLKLIHLNDDESYINYSIEVSNKVNAKVIDIYSRISRETHMLTEVLVNRKASLNYFAFSRSESPMYNYFNAFVDTKSTLTVSNMMANEDKYKLLSNIYIYDSFSKVSSYNAIVNDTKETQEFDYNVFHLKGESQSLMYNNAIVNSDSYIILNTDGIIKKGAIGTDLNQKSKGILLDEKSNIIANPILEIDEYDCKASHGAGVGAIDESDLFYLMSRGIQKDAATKLIIHGYLDPVLKEIEDTNVVEYIKNIVNEKI